MIIWQGLGFIIPFIAMANYALANWIVDTYIKYGYSNLHTWPAALAFCFSGAICWFIGNFFHQQPGHEVIDKKTGEIIEIKTPDTLFFIPMRYWGVIFVIMGISAFFMTPADVLGK